MVESGGTVAGHIIEYGYHNEAVQDWVGPSTDPWAPKSGGSIGRPRMARYPWMKIDGEDATEEAAVAVLAEYAQSVEGAYVEGESVDEAWSRLLHPSREGLPDVGVAWEFHPTYLAEAGPMSPVDADSVEWYLEVIDDQGHSLDWVGAINNLHSASGRYVQASALTVDIRGTIEALGVDPRTVHLEWREGDHPERREELSAPGW
jgi:hypothetical protein